MIWFIWITLYSPDQYKWRRDSSFYSQNNNSKLWMQFKNSWSFGVGVNSFRRLTLHFEIMCCSMNCMFIWALKSSTIWKMLFCLSCDNIWLVLEISLQITKTIRHCTDSHKTMIHCTTFFWISVLLGKTRSGQWVGCCRCSIVRLNLIKHDWETSISGSSVTLDSDSFLLLVSFASSSVNVLEHWF